MKIAILTSGILPVPAVRGGAVETLTDFYLEYNEQHRLHDITVFSVWHPDLARHRALQSGANRYVFVKMDTPWAKLKKKWFQLTHRHCYYHYSIEYFLNEAVRQMRKEQYDCIILENRPGFALRLKGNTQARLVYHLHNDFLNDSIPAHQSLYDAAWRIVTVSNFIARRVKTIDHADRKCVTVYNGIDLSSFQTTTQKTEQHEGTTLFFCGRLIPEKGIMPLLQAMEKLQQHPDIRLVIVGGASLGSNDSATPFLQELKEKAKRLSSVSFTGYVTHQEMASIMHESDVAVLPSLWDEPFGLTVVEAMAAGLPLITTRCGGITEICEGVATLVDREAIVDNLVAAILDLHERPEKRRAMALAAQERAKQFDKAVYAKKFFEAIG